MNGTDPRTFETDHGVYGPVGDVSPWDVRFDPDDRAYLDVIDDRYRLRVWAEPNLSDGLAVVRHGDGHVTGWQLEASITSRFSIWEGLVDARPGDEVSLAFRSPTGAPVYRVPSGISNAVERLDRWQLPPLAPLDVPDWVEGAVIYQVFPDRFANGDPALMPGPTDPWGSPPHPRRFQGGDLVGLRHRLDYLTDLGVDVIYLNPVFLSPSNHRYDTIDYLRVDPALGGDEALGELVDAAHRLGLRVLLDASFNHVHPRFFAFADVVARGPESPYWRWFNVREWPLKVRYRPERLADDPGMAAESQTWEEEIGVTVEIADGPGPPVEASYETWYSVPTMPRVDVSHPEARAYMLDVARHWTHRLGIDGWRMDVARYVDPDFWGDFRTTVREANPDAYLLGEVMGDGSAWLQGDRFDAVMGYTFRSLALRFFARDEIDGAGLLDGANRLAHLYASDVALASHNLLSSHDTPRFLHLAGEEEWRLHLATVFQLTFPGAPGLYYGDEVGMTGPGDPGSRGAFPWEPEPEDHPLHKTVRDLTRLRKQHPALRRGRWRPLCGDRHMIAYQRIHDGEVLTVAINRGEEAARLSAGTHLGEVVWGPREHRDGDLRVPGRSAIIVAR